MTRARTQICDTACAMTGASRNLWQRRCEERRVRSPRIHSSVVCVRRDPEILPRATRIQKQVFTHAHNLQDQPAAGNVGQRLSLAKDTSFDFVGSRTNLTDHKHKHKGIGAFTKTIVVISVPFSSHQTKPTKATLNHIAAWMDGEWDSAKAADCQHRKTWRQVR